MSWVDQTVAEFGQTLGMSDLAFDNNGLIQLAFERSGTLFLEKADNEVLAYLVRQVPNADAGVYRRALSSCHYDRQHPVTIQAGLRGDSELTFLARIPEPDFQLPLLERVFQLLDELHNKIAEDR